MVIERRARLTFERIAKMKYVSEKPVNLAVRGPILAQLNPEFRRPVEQDIEKMVIPTEAEMRSMLPPRPCSLIMRAILDGEHDMIEGRPIIDVEIENQV